MLTLVITCLFAVAWVRSTMITDTARFHYKTNIYEFISHHGSVEFRCQQWGVHDGHPGAGFSFGNGQFRYTSSDNQSADLELLFGIPKSKRWHFVGFVSGTTKHQPPSTSNMIYAVQTIAWAVGYWTIVVPLTLLSAWLLLSKPKQRKPSVEQQANA